jgi:hypothetical protein
MYVSINTLHHLYFRNTNNILLCGYNISNTIPITVVNTHVLIHHEIAKL